MASTDELVQRVAWSLVWLGVLSSGLDAWGQWSGWPGMAIAAPLIALAGIVGGTLVWAGPDPGARWLQGLGLGAAGTSVLLTQGVVIGSRHYYATDSAAFTHLATRLLLQGRDPYRASLAGAGAMLHPAAQYWTYLTNGGHVTRLSYPAGSIVLQAPFETLGIHHLTTDWVDLVAWIATGVVLALCLPRALRWLAPLLLLSGAYLFSFVGGGTDALFVPFLVLALWRWDRAALAGSRRWAAWLSPAALGVACSIKQSPWIVVPFLLVSVALEARRAGRGAWGPVARYGAIAAGAFLAFNLPFIVWDPSAWFHGTFLPMTSPLVPDGQGLVTLALHGITGGAALGPLTLAAALVLVTLLVALALSYPVMKRLWPFLVPLVLFVPGRSFSSYLLDFLPAALVAATSVAPVLAARRSWSWRRVGAVAAPAVLSLVAATLALTSAPLTIRVTHVTSIDHHQAFSAVSVVVRNDTAATLDPHFMVSVGGGHPSGFWPAHATAGRLPLAPHASATVVLLAPTWFWSPAPDGYFLVTAYSSGPSALSTSPPQRWPYAPG